MCVRWQILFAGWPPPSGPWVSGQAPGMQEKQITLEPRALYQEKSVHVYVLYYHIQNHDYVKGALSWKRRLINYMLFLFPLVPFSFIPSSKMSPSFSPDGQFHPLQILRCFSSGPQSGLLSGELRIHCGVISFQSYCSRLFVF